MNPSADKRSVSTDALETLGMIHFKQEHRDAIHLAVEPVEAAENLAPGESIVIKEGKAYRSLFNKRHGIVDPFLPHGPVAGEKFWFIMNPRMVKSLRHVWEHPEFPEGE
jgi:hypothetical protein